MSSLERLQKKKNRRSLSLQKQEALKNAIDGSEDGENVPSEANKPTDYEDKSLSTVEETIESSPELTIDASVEPANVEQTVNVEETTNVEQTANVEEPAKVEENNDNEVNKDVGPSINDDIPVSSITESFQSFTPISSHQSKDVIDYRANYDDVPLEEVFNNARNHVNSIRSDDYDNYDEEDGEVNQEMLQTMFQLASSCSQMDKKLQQLEIVKGTQTQTNQLFIMMAGKITTSLSGLNENYEKQIVDYQRRLEHADNTVSDLKVQNRELFEKYTELIKSNSKLQSTLQDLTSKIDKMNHHNETTLNTTASRFEKQLHEKDVVIASLKAELASAQKSQPVRRGGAAGNGKQLSQIAEIKNMINQQSQTAFQSGTILHMGGEGLLGQCFQREIK